MLGLGSSLTTGGGVMALSPPDISGLDLWLKVNTGIVGNAGGASADGDMANGEDINSWADQSGKARHASQGTAAKKPHWETDAADFGAINFSNASALMQFDLAQYSSADIEVAGNTDFTIMIRAKVSDFSAARSLIGATASDVIKVSNTKQIVNKIHDGTANTWAESSDTLATDTYYIFSLTRSDDSTGNLTMRVHGGSYTDKSWDSAESHTDADAFSINNIAAQQDGTLTFQGFMKDVIVWNGTALTTAQRNDMYSYINGQEY